jgi:hypothetical protein
MGSGCSFPTCKELLYGLTSSPRLSCSYLDRQVVLVDLSNLQDSCTSQLLMVAVSYLDRTMVLVGLYPRVFYLDRTVVLVDLYPQAVAHGGEVVRLG